MSLHTKIVERRSGICLYGLAPPKRDTAAAEIDAIAAQQEARLASLGLDGLIVYELQDEAERTSEPRPFPFLPTVDPHAYAHQHLARLKVPKIVYRCVSRVTVRPRTSFDLHAPGAFCMHEAARGKTAVLV